MPFYVSKYLSTKQALERKCSYCQVMSLLFSGLSTNNMKQAWIIASLFEKISAYYSHQVPSVWPFSISFSFQPNTNMRSSQRALFGTLFALICLLIIMCSLLSFKHEMRVLPRDRNQPRRLLVSITPFSAESNKLLGEAMEDPKKSVETSLRKAPPSKSNPSQNK
jgi:hypothetical protein